MTAHAVNEPRNLLEELRAVTEAIAEQDRGPADLDATRAKGEALAARITTSGAFPELVS